MCGAPYTTLLISSAQWAQTWSRQKCKKAPNDKTIDTFVPAVHYNRVQLIHLDCGINTKMQHYPCSRAWMQYQTQMHALPSLPHIILFNYSGLCMAAYVTVFLTYRSRVKCSLNHTPKYPGIYQTYTRYIRYIRLVHLYICICMLCRAISKPRDRRHGALGHNSSRSHHDFNGWSVRGIN